MKLSVSLSEGDVAMLDRYVEDHTLPSRSAAVQQAIRLLDSKRLAAEYIEAFVDWESDPGQQLWGRTLDDGLSDEAW